jgi:hypothetical protein
MVQGEVGRRDGMGGKIVSGCICWSRVLLFGISTRAFV